MPPHVKGWLWTTLCPRKACALAALLQFGTSPMEQLKTTKSARLRRLKMYREDLDQLMKLFQDSCARVALADDTTRYDNLDEMKGHVLSPIKHLDIRGEDPAVHFVLNQVIKVEGSSYGSSLVNELRTEEVSEAAEVLFFKLEDFLSEKQRPWLRIPFAIVSAVGLLLAIVGIGRESVTHSDKLPVLCGIGLLIFGIFGMLSGSVTNYVTLEKRIDTPSFWLRNREAFAVHAITALISAIIGGVVGYLLGRLTR